MVVLDVPFGCIVQMQPDSQQDEAKDKLKIEDAAKDGAGDGEDKKTGV